MDVNYFETSSIALRKIKDFISDLAKDLIEPKPKSSNEFKITENLERWLKSISVFTEKSFMIEDFAIFFKPSSNLRVHLRRDGVPYMNLLKFGEMSIKVVTTYDFEFAAFSEFAVPVALFFKFGDKAWLRYRKLLIDFTGLDKVPHKFPFPADRLLTFITNVANKLAILNADLDNELQKVVDKINKELNYRDYDLIILDVKSLHNCFLQKFEQFVNEWNNKRSK